MAIGPSEYLCDAWLDALGNATSFSVATVGVKLHVGDPGADGTANPATETGLKAVTFAAASGGTIASDADVTWTSIAGSEDATHCSFWDGTTGPGTDEFLGSGEISADAYTAGGDYTCPAGSLTISLTPAS
jgi:hypothetical protein